MPATTLTKERSSSSMTVKLDASFRSRIKNIATAKNRTSHYVMREAITQYLEKEEIEQHQIAIAEESLDHYEKTGLHVTLDEMKAWLKEKKLNRNTPMPVCHT